MTQTRLTADGVKALLNDIVDPCSRAVGRPLGLVDMGLAYEVSVSNRKVVVRLGVTDPRCMMAAVFLAEARSRLAPLVGARALEIALEDKEIWTPARMNAAPCSSVGGLQSIPGRVDSASTQREG